jgi:hypothetical protein
MRVALLASALLLTNAAAHADGTSNVGMCSTSSFQLMATFGLSFLDSVETDVSPTLVNTALNLQDCLCNPTDTNVSVRVTMSSLTTQQVVPLEVWLGSGCESTTNRFMNSTVCKHIATSLTSANFSNGGSSTSQLSFQPFLTRDLVNPGGADPQPASVCTMTTTATSLYFIFNPTAATPDICSISLPVDMAPVQPAQNPVATSGDQAVTISWNNPPSSAPQPIGYQVLCADQFGNPIAGAASFLPNLSYDFCKPDGTVVRRNLSSGTSTQVDGGVVTDTDAGLNGASAPPDDPPLHTDANPPDGGVVDPFNGGTNLDPRFLCSNNILPAQTSTRIDGLVNGEVYSFVVVGFDISGNPSPTAVVQGTPQPVEDLYRRYRDEGGKASGFCFVATAAYGSYEDPFVQVLREFRDRELLPSAAGRAFVEWYYRNSPPAASYIAEHPAARFLARQALQPAIVLALLSLRAAPLDKGLLCGLAMALVLVTSFRRKKSARPVRGAA